MRNVTTICICLPAELAEILRADAQRLGLSLSGYVKMRLQLSGTELLDLSEVMDDGGTD